MSNLFDVDIKGFKQTIQGEAARILLEPISNALDTEATEIKVRFLWGSGVATYEVIDNDPDGFAHLKDAYTLFAPSTRKADATKRGRFGFGEKEFVALCYPGQVLIESTTGAVLFDKDLRSPQRARTKVGSRVHAEFRLPKDQSYDFIRRVKSLIIPEGINFTFLHRITVKGIDTISEWAPPRRELVASFEAVLPTVSVDEDGNLRPTRRSAKIDVYEPEKGEQTMIYELGVPVVDHDSRFDINVHQKVPLNRSRDNVTPAYLRTLRELVLNNTFNLLTSVDAKKSWVIEALPNATPEALTRVIHETYGADAVIFDPSNPEASKKAIEQGRGVVYGRQLPTAVWSAIKEHEVLKPAGQVIQTGVPTSPDGKPPIPDEDWTEAMHDLAYYARVLGKHLLGRAVDVQFHNISKFDGGRTGDFAAWWGSNTITFNLGCLGKSWPAEASQEKVDALIIHEFAHAFASDHYSAGFYNACCDLGAKLRSCREALR